MPIKLNEMESAKMLEMKTHQDMQGKNIINQAVYLGIDMAAFKMLTEKPLVSFLGKFY